MKRELNSNLSSDEVCYTNYLFLLVKNMLCSKIHCQKDFDMIVFLHKILEQAHNSEVIQARIQALNLRTIHSLAGDDDLLEILGQAQNPRAM